MKKAPSGAGGACLEGDLATLSAHRALTGRPQPNVGHGLVGA